MLKLSDIIHKERVLDLCNSTKFEKHSKSRTFFDKYMIYYEYKNNPNNPPRKETTTSNNSLISLTIIT